MTCDHCAATLTKSLKTTPGVRDAQVDLQTRTARVDYDDKLSGITELMAAVQRAGFEVEGFRAM
jgi:copper chaperone CopZ